MKFSFKFLKSLFTKEGIKRYLHHLYSLKEKPSKIALSVALGILIGTAIPIGLQTIVTIPLCLLFDCNIILATTATLISNPITVLLAIKIGESLTSIKISWNEVNNLMAHPSSASFYRLGTEGLTVFATGILIMAFVFTVSSYFITLRLVTTYRAKHFNENAPTENNFN